MSNEGKISQLFIYPIKSLGGISVESALVTDHGFQYDRRYVFYLMNFTMANTLATMAISCTIPYRNIDLYRS